jgi:DNA-binding PadR family transcriptional regulator
LETVNWSVFQIPSGLRTGLTRFLQPQFRADLKAWLVPGRYSMIDYSIVEQLTPDYVLLGLLAAQPCHGYQLLDIFRRPDQLGRVWHLGSSQLYAVLKRLEQKAWITGQEVTVADAPPRTEYNLTALGQQQLEQWLYEPAPSASIRRVRVEFLSRLYVARLLNIPTAQIVSAQKKACREHKGFLVEQQAKSTPGVGLLALEFVIYQLEAILRWIDRCESESRRKSK